MKKFLKVLKNIAINVLVIVLLLVFIDFVITKLNLVPLRVPLTHPVYGMASEPVILNDKASKDSLTIVVIGDSHLEYGDKNTGQYNQCTYLYNYLKEKNIPARVIILGTPSTGFIQQMFIYDEQIKKKGIKPDVVLFQIYSGNDFSENLRYDDRPRVDFKADGTPDTVPIHWVLDRPKSKGKDTSFTSWPRDSRLLYLTNAAFGHHNMVLKAKIAYSSNDLLGFGLGSKIEYIKNLNRFVDKRLTAYNGAVAAQFLNQYYQMNKKPDAFMKESKVRTKYFLEYFKKSNPEVTCIVSYLPSAPAIGAMCDTDVMIYHDILKRSNLSDLDVPKMEHQLYMMMDSLNNATGKPFIVYDLSDTLHIANKLDGTQTFYDKGGLHVTPKSRKIIGETWGKQIIKYLETKKKVNS